MVKMVKSLNGQNAEQWTLPFRFNTSTLQHFNTSTLQHFNTSTLQHFNTATL